ncbi:MAG: ABC transporter ATP-binding protein [Burkholderiaceae bacterium]|nr:ABC transporter ATP-binding protein [Burkholderiaceae bacterium]
MTPLLEVTGLRKTFGGIVAVASVDLEIRRGERIGLIGPNGSGKTSLMNCVAGTFNPTAGSVRFADSDITRLPAHARARLGISRTFQLPKPFFSLTLAENLMIPLEFCGDLASSSVMRDQAWTTLRLLGLDKMGDDYAGALTQVDLRKLELARSVVVSPRLLIADETMAGLSTSEVDEILDVLVVLAEKGITIILIEHIMRAILSFSRRVVCLDAGVKIADGRPDEVMSHPQVERAYLGE